MTVQWRLINIKTDEVVAILGEHFELDMSDPKDLEDARKGKGAVIPIRPEYVTGEKKRRYA